MLTAVDEFAYRMRKALRAFRASDDPIWTRTEAGVDCFKDLPMEHLPLRLVEDLNRRFARINEIIAPHEHPVPGQQYMRVRTPELIEIQDLIEGCLLDPPEWPATAEGIQTVIGYER